MSYSEMEKPPVAKPKKARILIIEDNPDQWTIIQSAIQENFESPVATRVANAQQALAHLEDALTIGDQLPQLILLDLYLPERQIGWQVLRSIKSMAAPVNLIPVVVLSFSSDPTDIMQSYDLGAASYLTKPVDVKEWRAYFQTLSEYWWDAVTLPQNRSY